MDLEEMRQTARHARADAAEATTQGARVELAQAAHQLVMTAEICERLERIEAAIRALGGADQSIELQRNRGEFSDCKDEQERFAGRRD